MIKWKRTTAPANSECDKHECPRRPEYVLWDDLVRHPKPILLCAWHADKMIPRIDPSSA